MKLLSLATLFLSVCRASGRPSSLRRSAAPSLPVLRLLEHRGLASAQLESACLHSLGFFSAGIARHSLPASTAGRAVNGERATGWGQLSSLGHAPVPVVGRRGPPSLVTRRGSCRRRVAPSSHPVAAHGKRRPCRLRVPVPPRPTPFPTLRAAAEQQFGPLQGRLRGRRAAHARRPATWRPLAQGETTRTQPP